MWPRLLYTADLVCNGTGDTGTLRSFMGKPSFPSMFDAHRTSLLQMAFDQALHYTKAGVYKTRSHTPNTPTGIAHPAEYHAAKMAFVTRQVPHLMAAINMHYTNTWKVSLPQASKLMHAIYHMACDHEDPDGSLALWLALHVPTLHKDAQAPYLIPLL